MKPLRIIFLILLMSVLPIQATPNNKTLLQSISHRISQIREKLHLDFKRQSTLQKKLRSTEINMDRLLKEAKHTDSTLEEQKKILQELKNSEEGYLKQLKINQTHLSDALYATYRMGRQPLLKVLLNRNNLNEFDRFSMYIRYFDEQISHEINDLKASLDDLQTTKSKIKHQTDILSKLKSKQEHQTQHLSTLNAHREALINQIQTHISTNQAKLKQLLANKQKLESTIKRLQAAMKRQSQQYGHFSSYRGHLSWPTKGHVEKIFGQRIQDSEIKWSGILIKAHQGNPVKAIASGKVIFANWLAGYGMLLIIDHGKGYMSLYGRNHALFKTVGDHVRSGETIASVGQSGGHITTALYFAIRHNGNALNPSLWCH